MWLLRSDRHRRQREQLSAYVDGQLSSREERALEGHVASCESCRQALAELRSVVALLRATPQAVVPRSFALHQAPAQQPQWLRYQTPLRFAAAATAMLLVAVVAGDLATQSTPAVLSRTSSAAQGLQAEDAGATSSAVAQDAGELDEGAKGPALMGTPAPAPAPTTEVSPVVADVSSTPAQAAFQEKSVTTSLTLNDTAANLDEPLAPSQAQGAEVRLTSGSPEAGGDRILWRWAEGLFGGLLVLLAASAVAQSLLRTRSRIRSRG